MAINSTNPHEWRDVIDALDRDEVDVLLVSPERLNNPSFRDEQLPQLVSRIGLLVVDEAHCISDWGHDFRPDYRRLRDLIARIPAGVPVLATTATANSRVVADVAEQLDAHGPAGESAEVLVIRGPLARSSLRLGVLKLPTAHARLAWLLTHLGDLAGSGIIYTLTVAAANDTARLLRERGYDVRAYTGQTDADEREESEALLKDNRVKALVATSALGMGFDKPDLGFVVHLGAPSSPVAYYQQVGRAGRATASADVLLLPGDEDREIWHYFATASMPDRARADRVLAALSAAPSPMSTAALEAVVDIRRTPLELLLKVLDVDGAVDRVQGGWRATGEPWMYDEHRYARIAAERVAEQQHMLDYEQTDACRMEFLQRTLDDDTAVPCGRCDTCAGAWYPAGVTEDATQIAVSALDRVGVPIEPRRQWPTGADRLGVPVRGRIAADEQYTEGRALARLTDLAGAGCCAACSRRERPTRPRPRTCSPPASACSPTGGGRSAPSRWSRCRPAPARCSSTRSPAISPTSVGCRSSARSTSSTAARRTVRAATAPSGWRGCGSGSARRTSTCRPVRSSSSTTSSTAVGRSPPPHASSAVPARPRCSRSRSPCAADAAAPGRSVTLPIWRMRLRSKTCRSAAMASDSVSS